MTHKAKCEIFLAINEDGDYEVGISEDDASRRLNGSKGGLQVRIINIGVKATAPAITNAEIDVSDEAGRTEAVEFTD